MWFLVWVQYLTGSLVLRILDFAFQDSSQGQG